MTSIAIACALLSAALFGVSTPLAKMLVGGVDAWMLAGLLYAGSGVGLGGVRLIQTGYGPASEASLSRRDAPWLAGAILAGGVAGPVLLMIGLQRAEASVASLLLTLEGVGTALIAWFVFRENFDRRIALGMGCIVAGVAWPHELRVTGLAGPLAVVGACVAWAIDNNLTRKVSLADPVQIAMLKGLVAGPVSIALALMNGAGWPDLATAGAAALVGFLGYGVSLVLLVLALRGLGTARTGAYFSTAPFLGAAAAVGLLGESISTRLVVAGGLMAAGVWLHLTERHEHEHGAMEHTHRHSHDAHHGHPHAPTDPPGEPHSHPHWHAPLRHAHPHVPDAHHHHSHRGRKLNGLAATSRAERPTDEAFKDAAEQD